MLFNENELIKKIRQKMKKKRMFYTQLAEKTDISEATLKRCLNAWSEQSLTLHDLEKIAQVLDLDEEEDELIKRFHHLPIETQEILKKLIILLDKNT